MTSVVAPPMTPAMPIGPVGIGDEQRLGVELARDVIERLEALPGPARRTMIRPSWTRAASKVWIGLPSSSIT